MKSESNLCLCNMKGKVDGAGVVALNKQRVVYICNFRHTLVSDSHRAHSPVEKVFETVKVKLVG